MHKLHLSQLRHYLGFQSIQNASLIAFNFWSHIVGEQNLSKMTSHPLYHSVCLSMCAKERQGSNFGSHPERSCIGGEFGGEWE